MTIVQTEGGAIETTLPPEAVADLQPKVDPAPAAPADTGKPAEGSNPPVEPKTEEPTSPEAPKEPEKPTVPTAPVTERPKKATPFQTLLDKKHDAETRAEAAEAKAAVAEAKLQELAGQKPGAATSADIKAFAEKWGIEEAFAADLVAQARAGLNIELPKEVTELIAESQARKQQEAEHTAFNKRVDSLAVLLKDDLLKTPEVREKLMKLAYSTEKAPDGEPYYQKELAEIYFAYIKPEVEPAKPSIESGRGANKGTSVIDFQEVFDRDDPKDVEAMDAETFESYSKWLGEKGGNTPIRRAN